MRTLRLLVPMTVTLGLALLPRAASAQGRGFAVDKLDPAERGSDWFTTESLDIRGHGRAAVGAVAAYAVRPLRFDEPGTDTLRNSLVRNQLLVHTGASFILWERLRLGLSVPVQLFADGHGGTVNGVYYAMPEDEVSVGDVRIGADLRLLGMPKDGFSLAFGTQLHVPSGSTQSYTGDGSARIAPRFLAAGDVGDFAYAARLGLTYRGRDDAFADGQLGSEFTFGASFGVRLLDKKMLIGPEIFGSTVLDDAFGKRATPVEVLLGAHHRLTDTIRTSLGAGTGITEGFGAPQLRVIYGLEWVPEPPKAEVAAVEAKDTDKDGIDDAHDACVDIPGEKSADPKLNGCPPPDADHDGVLDREDACPTEYGRSSNDPKTNGCPSDKDGDGVPDCDDACPYTAGVRSDDPKKNGCPADSDGDGIDDATDACPNQAGIRTSDPKTNGCPDTDLDKDGITNDKDACPNEAGPSDPDPKKNGCPKAFMQGDEIKITDQVKFKTGSAEIVGKDSEEVLQAVLGVLQKHPEAKKVRIEGHTDDRGAAAANRKLSADRAAAVMKWLVGKGIDKDRLTSQGFGPDKPLLSNDTEQGRAANRRVEFHIEKGN